MAKWTLIDTANSPEAVEEWHAKMTRKHGPVSANHAARLIRATYKRRAARDVTLSLDRLPTSSVQWNKEEPVQHALASRDFAKWRAAWDKIENPVHRAYHLFCLLTGVRRGKGLAFGCRISTRMRACSPSPTRKPVKTSLCDDAGDRLRRRACEECPAATDQDDPHEGMKRGERKLVDRKHPIMR